MLGAAGWRRGAAQPCHGLPLDTRGLLGGGISRSDAAQREVALKTFDVESARFPERKIVTEVLPLTIFYDAEDYHMQYLQKKGQSAKKNDEATIRCYG